MQWSGVNLYNIQVLVCSRCYDSPQEQLRTVILPPDPPSVINARVPDFAYEGAGPVQAQLAADTPAGSTLLYVSSVSGFEVGNSIWIQLNNGSFAQESITVVDSAAVTLTIANPLPFSAPENGQITVSST